MLDILKKWIVGEKARLNGFMHGNFSLESARQFELAVRNAGFTGVMRATRGQHAEFSIEGSKPKLEKFLLGLPPLPSMRGIVLKISWAEAQGRFDTFRLTID